MLHMDAEPRVGYLYVSVSGELDMAGAQSALRDLLASALRHGRARILMDCSRVHGQWSADDRYAFGTFFAAEVQRAAGQFDEFPRIAIYAIAPLMDPNRYMQQVATNRGALVRASDSLQELYSWLGV
jgi:hypothetical protein